MTRRKRGKIFRRALTRAQWKRGFCELLLRGPAAGVAPSRWGGPPLPPSLPLPIQPRRPLRGLKDHPRYAGKVLLVTVEACRRDQWLARAYCDWLMANANRWFADGRCSFTLLFRCIWLALNVEFSTAGLRSCLTNVPRRVNLTLQAAGRRFGGWPVRTGPSPGLTAWIAMWQRTLCSTMAYRDA